MNIPLKEFEEHISETILNRGLSYFRNKQVNEPEEISEGQYEFIVEGSDNYTVEINLDDGIINHWSCDCPYDAGPVCKHIAAALFYLKKEETGRPETTVKKGTEAGKRKTKVEKVNELLEKVPHDALKQFVRKIAEHDRDFRNMLLANFSHPDSAESKSLYAKQVKSILKAASRRGYIDYTSAGAVYIAVNSILEAAQQQLETGKFDSAFYISTAVMEEMTAALQFADDSNGSIGGNIERAFGILHQIVEENIGKNFRKQILNYCFTVFDKKLFEGWDHHTGILSITAILIETENEAEEAINRLDRLMGSDYVRHTAQQIHYDILLKIKGEAVAEVYLAQHLDNMEFRQKSIQKALEISDFNKARNLARDGIAADRKDSPGLVKIWYDWLLKIAQAEGITDEIIEYARYLLIDNFSREQDYYQILKKYVKPEDWTDYVEGLIKDISEKNVWTSQNLIADIYIREEWWERLLDLVKRGPSFIVLDNYEKHLAGEYARELVNLYAAEIMRYLEKHVARNHYQLACRYLKRMKKLGGKDKAVETVALLRAKYPQRRALMEELNQMG